MFRKAHTLHNHVSLNDRHVCIRDHGPIRLQRAENSLSLGDITEAVMSEPRTLSRVRGEAGVNMPAARTAGQKRSPYNLYGTYLMMTINNCVTGLCIYYTVLFIAISVYTLSTYEEKFAIKQ